MMSLNRRAVLAGSLGLLLVPAASSRISEVAPKGPRLVGRRPDTAPTLAQRMASLDTDEEPLTLEDRAYARETEKAAASTVIDTRAAGFGSLQLFREANGESIAARYRTGDEYDQRALAELSWFWRDVKDEGRAVWVDPTLFDFVSSIQTTMAEIHGGMLPFVLTSGYRTPRHNATIENAARNSQHLSGRAGDFKVPGYPPRSIAIAGMTFKGGGVGVYRNFTHLDIGDLRCWPRGCDQLVANHG